MPLIPIGTDVRPHRPPVGNYVLLSLNVLVFAFTDFAGGAAGQQLKSLWTLYASVPDLGQYITYQFLHGDIWHLLGNMLFLWIFGNAVCDRMGSLCYILFYLAGGVCAGVTFATFNDTAILGASGAIAAVTTAFLVLFPRVHVTMLLWMIVTTAFQLPATVVIVFKIILWDNIIAPNIAESGVANVAYSAHLGGYGFGFCVALAMLAVRALPRNQFDMLALWSRWQRRSGLLASDPFPRARPISVEEVDSRPLEPLSLSPEERLRQEILDRLEAGDFAAAAALYPQLRAADPQQVMPRQAQLDLANYLAQTQRQEDAVAAYESFLVAYPTAPDTPQVHLLLGLILGRYVRDTERAAEHLRAALRGLTQASQRALAESELRRLGVHPPDSDITGG